MIDVILATLLGRFRNRATGLALGADPQDPAAAGDNFPDRIHGLVEHGHGLLQVDDVNTLPGPEDVLIHLGIPAAGDVSEMHAGFK